MILFCFQNPISSQDISVGDGEQNSLLSKSSTEASAVQARIADLRCLIVDILSMVFFPFFSYLFSELFFLDQTFMILGLVSSTAGIFRAGGVGAVFTVVQPVEHAVICSFMFQESSIYLYERE